MSMTRHATTRIKQRGIPSLIDQWLDQFGEEQYDGNGGVIRFFSHASIRSMEHSFGRAPVRKLAEYFHAYKVESSHDGCVITIGHRTKHIKRT